MRERVMKFDAQHWARTFIQQLGATDITAAPAPETPEHAIVLPAAPRLKQRRGGAQ
ncbi:hypothetical protein BH20VER1_BH20VER1_07350 [soil metagenome]